MQILGVDPGIAHTAIAVVQFSKQRYELLSSQLVKTNPQLTDSNRLLTIFEAVYETLNRKGLDIEAVAIEKVFHGKNVSSSITTGKVIGAVSCVAAQLEISVLELTPQAVKKASGLGTKAAKEEMIIMASRIFKNDFTNHHEADAALCALAGLLKKRTVK